MFKTLMAAFDRGKGCFFILIFKVGHPVNLLRKLIRNCSPSLHESARDEEANIFL